MKYSPDSRFLLSSDISEEQLLTKEDIHGSSYLVRAVVREMVHTVRKPLLEIAKLRGRSLMIFGPAGAGKTSLLLFLHSGTLPDPNRDLASYAIETTAAFRLDLGDGQWLTFRYGKAYPGQLDPHTQAKLLRRLRPDLGLLVLDATSYALPSERQRQRQQEQTERAAESPTELIAWFEAFTTGIEDTYRRGKSEAKQHLNLIVAINKSDRISSTGMTLARKEISAIIRQRMVSTVGPHAVHFPIVACSMLEGSKHSKGRARLIGEIGRRFDDE